MPNEGGMECPTTRWQLPVNKFGLMMRITIDPW